jgi:pimeloyl-ACP methyl ester carboxylesterase
VKKKFWGVSVLLLAVAFMAAVGGCGGGGGGGGADYEVSIKDDFDLTNDDGYKLYLARYETDEPGDKTPLLMVHGLTYSSHEFDVDYEDYSLARFFAREGYSVWLLDVTGYGRSQKVNGNGYMVSSDYAAEDIRAAAELIVKESGTDKLNVLGWSWGTVTSGRFAAKYPALVDKLVLYAPILLGYGLTGATPEYLEELGLLREYRQTTWDGAMEDFQPIGSNIISYDIVEPPVAATYLFNCWRYDGAGSPGGGLYHLLVGGNDLIPIEAIKAPTLLIAGDKDNYVFAASDPDRVELLKEVFDAAFKTLEQKGLGSKKIVPDAAHAMLMEKPYYKEFREAVLDFLKK